jgi:hypothetical protein
MRLTRTRINTRRTVVLLAIRGSDCAWCNRGAKVRCLGVRPILAYCEPHADIHGRLNGRSYPVTSEKWSVHMTINAPQTSEASCRAVSTIHVRANEILLTPIALCGVSILAQS